jgi:hypothetical protein
MLRCTRQIHQIQQFPDKFKLFCVGCIVESWLFLISRLWSLSTSIIDSPHNFSSFFFYLWFSWSSNLLFNAQFRYLSWSYLLFSWSLQTSSIVFCVKEVLVPGCIWRPWILNPSSVCVKDVPSNFPSSGN